MKNRSILLALVAALPMLADNRAVDTPLRIIAGNTTHAKAIFAGDFTSDGKPDILQVETGKLRVLPGTAGTLFGTPTLTDLIDGTAEGLADFNRDGRPDLYLRTSANGAVVMDGNANGTFATQRTVPVTRSVSQLVAADFTGDTYIDLAAAGDGHVVVYRGDGNGGFPSSYELAVSVAELADLAAGDFDGDGRVDLLLARGADNLIAWNTGTSFTLASQGGSGSSAAAGDVNGDGIMDAITHEQRGARIQLGSHSRTLPAVTFPLDDGLFRGVHTDIEVAALDGDGRAEVLLTIDDGVVVLSHDGTNFRKPRVYHARAGGTNSIAAADFTGDGHVDVARLGEASNQARPEGEFSLLRGRGDGTLRAAVMLDLRAAVHPHEIVYGDPIVGDVNGDGYPDVVFGAQSSDDYLTTLLAGGDGTFASAVLTVVPDGYDWTVHDAGDLNADGRTDVVRAARSFPQQTRLEVWLGQSNGSFLPGASYGGAAGSLQRIVDYTGDGHVDLLDVGGNLFPGSGNGTFGAPIQTGVTSFGLNTVVIGDANNDTRPDIFIYGAEEKMWTNNGGGSFASARPSVPLGLAAIADMNGDDVNDAISSGVMLGTGGGAFNMTRAFELDHERAQVADFDGDGHRDVASPRMIYFGTGTGTFDDATQTSVGDDLLGYEPWVFSTADSDGNGSPDLWITGPRVVMIVPTRAGVAGTVEPQVTASTNPEPSPWLESFDVIATLAPSLVGPRGGALFTVNGVPHAIARVTKDGRAVARHPHFSIGSTVEVDVAFLGDEHYGPASASTSHTTIRARTSVTLSANTTFEIARPVSMRGFVGRRSGTPTGTVTYRVGDVVLATLDATQAQDVSVTDRELFPFGTHTLSASYSGDESYSPSQTSMQISIVKRLPTMVLGLPQPPVMAGQHTITATFPEDPRVTGSVTFACADSTIGTVAVANGQAAITTNFAAGVRNCSAAYSGDAEHLSHKVVGGVTVYRGTFPTPPAVTATFWSGGAILEIQPVWGAPHYAIYRSLDGGPFTHVASPSTLRYQDYNMPPPMKTAVYAVAALDGNWNQSPMGPKDFATNVVFTDWQLTGVLIKALHVTQLQSAINAVRRAAGLPQIAFNAPGAGTTVTAAQLSAMRNGLTEARSALGIGTTFTDAIPTVIRAIHLEELRGGVQ